MRNVGSVVLERYRGMGVCGSHVLACNSHEFFLNSTGFCVKSTHRGATLLPTVTRPTSSVRIVHQLAPILNQTPLFKRFSDKYSVMKYTIPPANTRLVVTAFITRLESEDIYEDVTHLLDAFVYFMNCFAPLLISFAGGRT